MKWGRVLLAAVAVLVADLLAITLVVTAYAFKLAFEARGAPDQVKIAQFAGQFGRSSWFVIGAVLTILAAAWVVRRAQHSPRRHGAVVGVIAGIITSLPGLAFSLRTLGEFGVTVAAGVLGGWLAGKVGIARLPRGGVHGGLA
jgi:hypothetical protein